jgi:hypothetical protein
VRASLLVAVATALVACGSTSATETSNRTSLTVTYWPQGPQAAAKRTWTVRCDPAAGTLPQPVRACRKLAAGGTRLFRPVPRGTVCTEIYGGPQRARVVGTVSGQRSLPPSTA